MRSTFPHKKIYLTPLFRLKIKTMTVVFLSISTYGVVCQDTQKQRYRNLPFTPSTLVYHKHLRSMKRHPSTWRIPVFLDVTKLYTYQYELKLQVDQLPSHCGDVMETECNCTKEGYQLQPKLSVAQKLRKELR